TVKLWDVKEGRCLCALEGHTAYVTSVAWSADQKRALSGSEDQTVRVWDLENRLCLRVFEGHLGGVSSLTFSVDGRLALSGSSDRTARLWDVETGRCLCVFNGHDAGILNMSWSADGFRAFSADYRGGIREWDLSEFVIDAQAPKVNAPALPLAPEQVQYTNAKVLLVGETSAGKTGLSKRLALGKWEPSDSTVGAW